MLLLFTPSPISSFINSADVSAAILVTLSPELFLNSESSFSVELISSSRSFSNAALFLLISSNIFSLASLK
jgi:hypothetical protein